MNLIDLARVRAGDAHADRAAALGVDPGRVAAWLATETEEEPPKMSTETQIVIRMPGPLLAKLDTYVEALKADPDLAAKVLGAHTTSVNRSAVIRALVDRGIGSAHKAKP
jgi:hypothetical protein